ncbi:MAG: metal-dependent phosphohydrolase [Acholeplasmataceae bacterium]|nr:metal-dependent phosphohydrolase [Acholeplasmataceae bacterium]
MFIEGKIENLNIGEDYFNCNIVSSKNERLNIKLTKEQAYDIKVDKVYHFEFEQVVHNDKIQNHLVNYQELFDYVTDPVELKEKLSEYYEFSPVSTTEIKQAIEAHLGQITNKVLLEVTTNLYKTYEKGFYTYPAAVKFHHAYIGGLAYHTKTMLDLATKFIEVYPFINKDLVYSAIILHDLCKVEELSGFEGGEYTAEGQLIGHLVMISQKVVIEATKLGYQATEEVLMLNHILLAHHGLPNFGAAKRPQTAEALLVWYVDTIDSKFTVLGEVLENTEPSTFTPPIGVIDKTKMYKHNIK